MMTNLKSIAIIGRVPLPYGGVSVHLDRLLSRLRSESIEYDFYDLGAKSDPERRIFPGKRCLIWLIWFLLRSRQRYQLIHFHASNPYTLIAADMLMLGSGTRLAYSLHGEGLYRWATNTGPWFLRWMLRKALQRADHLFPINPLVAKKLPDLGVDPCRISWMAAYLPPTEEEMSQSHLSPETKQFFESHSLVIAMQAWFGAFQGDRDIYGLEQMVPLLNGVREEFLNVGLCTVISGTYSLKHRQRIYALREEAELVDDWLLLDGSAPAVSLFSKCDLFLRPTISDGDSMSVRECLSFGIPVVASDAVPRPSGCRLYPVDDMEKMIDVVGSVLQEIKGGGAVHEKHDDDDHASVLLEYYRDVLNE